MRTEDYFKNFKTSRSQIEHALQTEKLSLVFFDNLKKIYPDDEKLNFKNAKKLLSISAKLHDIGVFFEKSTGKPHNKMGAKLILENKIDGLEENEIKICALAVRYHRGSKPKDGKHRLFSSLVQEDKKKVLTLSSIIRIADALDYNHISIVENILLKEDIALCALTVDLGINIMFNAGIKDVFDKKKTLFEDVFKTKIFLKND